MDNEGNNPRIDMKVSLYLAEVSMIRNKINQILESLPEEELVSIYWSIEIIQKKYLFRKNLLEKGLEITELLEESQEIIDLWDSTFAQNISEELKETIYYNQYKWHIFSYEKKNCLKEEEARKAFDSVTKDDLFVMYQNAPVVEFYKNASGIVAADFDAEQDIYIFDMNFTWTYVHTHESMCGPYFCEVK